MEWFKWWTLIGGLIVLCCDAVFGYLQFKTFVAMNLGVLFMVGLYLLIEGTNQWYERLPKKKDKGDEG